MVTNLLIVVAFAALVLAAWALAHVRHLERVFLDHDLQLGAVRERAGVTDNDVDDYHDRVHPECAETGGR